MHDWLYSYDRSLCDHSLITNQRVIMQVMNEEMAGPALLKLETRPPSIPSSTSSSLVRRCLKELAIFMVTGYKAKLSDHLHCELLTCCQPRRYRSRLASVPCSLARTAPVSIQNEREAPGVKISQTLQTIALATQHVSKAPVFTCGLGSHEVRLLYCFPMRAAAL